MPFSASKLREIRKGQGLTQEQLAACMEIRPHNISRLESGRHSPSFGTVERLADCLGVTVDELREPEKAG